jgi:hypothetical protein
LTSSGEPQPTWLPIMPFDFSSGLEPFMEQPGTGFNSRCRIPEIRAEDPGADASLPPPW